MPLPLMRDNDLLPFHPNRIIAEACRLASHMVTLAKEHPGTITDSTHLAAIKAEEALLELYNQIDEGGE